MRWLKHLTAAQKDPRMTEILEEFGAEAYGVYWLLCEEIASTMEKHSLVTELVHSELRWAQMVYCSPRKFRAICRRFAGIGLIEVTSQSDPRPIPGQLPNNRLTIGIPKLLKYRDEYSKKSGHLSGHAPDSRERERTQKEANASFTETEREKERPPYPPEGGNPLAHASLPRHEELPPPAPPPAAQVLTMPAIAEATQMTARWIWERHPHHRRLTLEIVENSLRQQCRSMPAEGKLALMRDINERHQRWCACEEWAVENVVPNLDTWLAKHSQNEPPPLKRKEIRREVGAFDQHIERLAEKQRLAAENQRQQGRSA